MIERCLELYHQYWGWRKRAEKEKFEAHLKSSDVPRELITHELTEAEEYALKRLRRIPIARVRKASNVLYKRHPEMFEGKRILEIGSGRNIDKTLVELAASYHGIDPYYKMLGYVRAMQYMNEGDLLRMIGRALVWPIKLGFKLTDKGLRDDFAYDFDSFVDSLEFTQESGLKEYRNGEVRLIGGMHNQAPSTYDIVVNGSAPIDKDEVPGVKALLAEGGTYMIMSIPDTPIWKEDLTTNFFSKQREIWVELKGRKIGGVYTAFVGWD